MQNEMTAHKNDGIRLVLCKFRLSNHKLPIERGRYSNIEREPRFCQLCNENMIGDEFHFILECPALQHLRKHFYLNIVKPILTL